MGCGVTDLFVGFNFDVVITVGDDTAPLCHCGFAQVDGLELSIDNKTIRSGGDNGREIHLGGPVTNGTLTLKRGMTSSFDLWTWFERVNLDNERHLRARVEVVMLGASRSVENAAFVLDRCLPTKLRIPGLEAKTGEVAIEELTVAYESLRLATPTGGEG